MKHFRVLVRDGHAKGTEAEFTGAETYVEAALCFRLVCSDQKPPLLVDIRHIQVQQIILIGSELFLLNLN